MGFIYSKSTFQCFVGVLPQVQTPSGASLLLLGVNLCTSSTSVHLDTCLWQDRLTDGYDIWAWWSLVTISLPIAVGSVSL